MPKKYSNGFLKEETLLPFLALVSGYTYGPEFPFLEYAAIGKNSTLLRKFFGLAAELVSIPWEWGNRAKILDEELFNSISLKRKPKISFEAAKEFVENIRGAAAQKVELTSNIVASYKIEV